MTYAHVPSLSFRVSPRACRRLVSTLRTDSLSAPSPHLSAVYSTHTVALRIYQRALTSHSYSPSLELRVITGNHHLSTGMQRRLYKIKAVHRLQLRHALRPVMSKFRAAYSSLDETVMSNTVGTQCYTLCLFDAAGRKTCGLPRDLLRQCSAYAVASSGLSVQEWERTVGFLSNHRCSHDVVIPFPRSHDVV
jgi:hypothetical protein